MNGDRRMGRMTKQPIRGDAIVVRGTVREFRFRYKFKGNAGDITIGNCPGVSLGQCT